MVEASIEQAKAYFVAPTTISTADINGMIEAMFREDRYVAVAVEAHAKTIARLLAKAKTVRPYRLQTRQNQFKHFPHLLYDPL